MTTAAEARREAARGNGTAGGQFGFQDHTPPAPAPSAAWPGTNRDVRDHDFVPASAAEWPGLYGTEGQGSGLGGKQFVAHYSGPGYDYWVCEYDPETRQVFGYARIIGQGDGEYGYADLNELESTKIDVFNPASTSPSNWTVKTAAIHRDTGFEDLPSEQRYAHQHLDKYRGRVLDQLDPEDRDEMNGKVAQWQSAQERRASTVEAVWEIRGSAAVEAHMAQQEVEDLATEHGLVFDPADGGSFTVAAQPTEDASTE
ncbi:hypothetical protein [Pseudoclavibacter sp. VKM Ac-2888]|uniref:hypothetical protein n=1 Tax=Pseudoclavibacter sp. VKM Ac-2888 TaxID=2783830 RepID=UPI00188CC1EC|nr:hypothetical protein [Pseudoclavibacter sp. VKM Ac-2888]MBF4549303.1 hypothetical protein [Pseudoclavibacter sp. VKM Ac-2888]